jgi:hypothetical protein
MKVETPTLLCEWKHPDKKSGPCEWNLSECTPTKRTVLITGTCRTYKEARGLLSRIEKLAYRMYRNGHAAGRAHGTRKREITIMRQPSNAPQQGRRSRTLPAVVGGLDSETKGERRMFFSYDHEDGIEFHETAEEAKARAEKALDMDRDFAEDGWDDNVTDICWGEVKGRVVETMRRPTTPEDNTDCEEWVDYAMQDTPNKVIGS